MAIAIAALLAAAARAPQGPAPAADHRSRLAALLKNVDAAAHSAATSDLNLLRAPTKAQAEAGNYRKGHTMVSGLRIAIENPAGSRRRADWPPMVAHYGYVKGTEGADGDHVDVFLRPAISDDWVGTVYVVDQCDADGDFDEHKCLLGYDSQREATQAYLAHYPKGWRLGAVTALSLADFKAWLKTDTTQPIGKAFTQSTSATSGLTAYGSAPATRKRRRVRLLPQRSTP